MSELLVFIQAGGDQGEPMKRMAGLMPVACFRTGRISLLSRSMEKAPLVSS